MTMPALVMSLGRMVDLALGTPDVGAVNFNVLHSLLRAMVNHLGIVEVNAEISDDEAERVMMVEEDTARYWTERDGGGKTDGRRGKMDEDDGRRKMEGEDGRIDDGEVKGLEKRMDELEQQWKELSSYPSNEELVDYMRRRKRTVDEEEEEEEEEDAEGQSRTRGRRRRRPVSDMWLSLQLSKKVDANTEGVTKSLSLIEDLFHEIESIRIAFDQIEDQLKQSMESNERLRKTNSSIHLVGDDEELDVTPANDSISTQQQKVEMEVHVRKERSTLSTRDELVRSRGTSSAELEELTAKVERLTEEQETTKTRLNQLEGHITEKADRAELIGLGEELNEKMTNLFCDMDKLRRTQKENLDAVSGMKERVIEMEKSVSQFEETVDQLMEATQRLSDESINHQNHLETLFCSCKELNEKKADKDFVQNEVAIKANKDHLDEKVSSQNFHSTCDEINNNINDIINKLMGHEDDWKKTTLHLNSAVDAKLDRLEFGPFRDELERQLRLIAKRMANSQGGEGEGKGELTEEEAAGFRRQLIQTFHCLSCNKPLDMKPTQRPVPSLPSIPRLPETHSLRPHTVFELSQIRQLAHSHGNQQQQQSASQVNDHLLDLCSKPRFCGGSHTLTYPHRRITKLSLSSHLNPPPFPLPSDNPPPHHHPQPHHHPRPQPASSKAAEAAASGGGGSGGGGIGGGGGGGGGDVRRSSSMLLPNVHASRPIMPKSSSSSVRPPPAHPLLRVSRSSDSPVDDDHPLPPPMVFQAPGNQSTTDEGPSITDQQQPSSRSSKRERSKVKATKEEEEAEAERPETDRRSILSSSVSGFDNEATAISEREGAAVQRSTPEVITRSKSEENEIK